MLLTDYKGQSYDVQSATGAVAVVPSDGADLARGIAKGIYVGVAGNLRVTLAGGDTVTFTGIAAGTVHPLAVKRVFATQTTATDIVAVY